MTISLKTRISRRTGLTLAASATLAALAGSRAVAQTPEASPVAGGEVILPDGPLGVHAQWLLEVANAGPGKIKVAAINEHFSVGFFEETTMPEIFRILSDLQALGVTWEIDPESFITTMDLPASNGSFTLVGDEGSMLRVGITIDRESELIDSLSIEPGDGSAVPVASPQASPVS
jgi:hypothetical protein